MINRLSLNIINLTLTVLFIWISVFFPQEKIKEQITSLEDFKNTVKRIDSLVNEAKINTSASPSLAIQSFSEALKLAHDKKLNMEESIIHRDLSALYEKLGIYKVGLEHYKSYHRLSNINSINIDNGIRRDELDSKENELLKRNSSHQDDLIVKQLWAIILISITLLAFGIMTIILIKENRTIKKLNATKDKFFSIVTHDLKNPFHSILGGTKLLIEEDEEFSSEERKAFLEKIYDTSRATYTLLENLLQWSKSQTDVIELAPYEISLKELVVRNIALTQTAIDAKNIKVSETIDDEIKVFVDEFMIDTVVRNLLSNSVKFTPQRGEIKINAKREGKKIVFSIIDNGVGISKENSEKLFRTHKFFSTIGTMNEKGSGIGLLLCKEFIERHKEKIWVESEIGKGTTFYFTMPAV